MLGEHAVNGPFPERLCEPFVLVSSRYDLPIMEEFNAHYTSALLVRASGGVETDVREGMTFRAILRQRQMDSTAQSQLRYVWC